MLIIRMINVLRTLLFILFSTLPLTAIAVDLSSISRALEAIFDEYTSVHYQSLGRELDPELLASAGLEEVYRSDADGDQYVVYLLDAPVEILVYYFHNEQLLFLIDDNRKVDFDQVFSGVKNAKAGYTDEVKGPGVFVVDSVFPPKFVPIKYTEASRENFSITLLPNLEKPIYKLASDIVRDLALYRSLLTDKEILSVHKLKEADDNIFYRRLHDGTEIYVTISADTAGIAFTDLSTTELRDFLSFDLGNNLSQYFLPNLPDNKMQIVNDDFTVTLSVLEDIRGERLDLNTILGLTSGIRLHFLPVEN